MTGGVGAARIVCPVGVFAAQESQIALLTEELNHAATLPAKVEFATSLQRVAEGLIACKDRQVDNVNCRLCQEFSRLRANAAGLIVRTARLAS